MSLQESGCAGGNANLDTITIIHEFGQADAAVVDHSLVNSKFTPGSLKAYRFSF
jgi:hypothetical protein